MSEERSTNLYITAVVAAGLVCVIVAAAQLPLELFDLKFVLLAGLTLAIGSRSTIPIPRFKSHIAVSDTFIFLVLLLYGGEYAILLSAVEAFASSWRFCNKRITVFFNAATMAASTSSVVLALKALGLYAERQPHGGVVNGTSFVFALTVIALTMFVVNTSLAAVYDSLKLNVPAWEIWKTKYVWAFLTYFVGIGGASMLFQLSDMIGFGILAATFPLIFFVYLSYRMYLKNVEISVHQADQAKEYAQILEAQADALRKSEERFRSAFDYAPIGIALVSPSGAWLKVNQALSDILGYSEAEFLACDLQSLTQSEDLARTLMKVDEVLCGKIPNCQMEQRFRHRSGFTIWTSFSVSASSESASSQPNLIFQIQDITHKKYADQQLQHEATHDALTGLPNRSFFMNRLTAALAKAEQKMDDHNVSVLFIDLDRFKYVNDSLGHLIGDELLKGIAQRLRDCVRPSDVIARLGGDEFTILVEGTYDPIEVTHIAERIQKKFSVPFDLDGHEVYSSASIGILHASEKHRTSEDMMRDADTAMYQAKRAGKARHEVFDEKMHNDAKEILRLETDLRRAVEHEELSVYYQPIYTLGTGEPEGVEALARWHHPEFGDIPATKFIPLAEEIGLIDKLCEQVLRRACREIGAINRQMDGDALSVSVNLSCRQFEQRSLVSRVSHILSETGFSPFDLKVEITESVFIEYPQRAVEMLHQLRELGIEIDIDDFGTGYSNLGCLIELPISTLKVDRTFVAMIDEYGANDEIVRAIVTLARNLGLRVVAEGIETQAQLDKLKSLDCEAGQGYLFAAPMPADKLQSFFIPEWPEDIHLSNSGEMLLETLQ